MIGINQQIETASGTNSGVGFAIPASAIRFSLDQLREDGDVDYAYLGVTTQGLWPQLAEELDMDVETGRPDLARRRGRPRRRRRACRARTTSRPSRAPRSRPAAT